MTGSVPCPYPARTLLYPARTTDKERSRIRAAEASVFKNGRRRDESEISRRNNEATEEVGVVAALRNIRRGSAEVVRDLQNGRMIEELPKEDGNGRQTAIDRERERDKGKDGAMQLSRRWTDTTQQEQRKLDDEGIYKTQENGRRLDPSTNPALYQKPRR